MVSTSLYFHVFDFLGNMICNGLFWGISLGSVWVHLGLSGPGVFLMLCGNCQWAAWSTPSGTPTWSVSWLYRHGSVAGGSAIPSSGWRRLRLRHRTGTKIHTPTTSWQSCRLGIRCTAGRLCLHHSYTCYTPSRQRGRGIQSETELQIPWNYVNTLSVSPAMGFSINTTFQVCECTFGSVSGNFYPNWHSNSD